MTSNSYASLVTARVADHRARARWGSGRLLLWQGSRTSSRMSAFDSRAVARIETDAEGRRQFYVRHDPAIGAVDRRPAGGRPHGGPPEIFGPRVGQAVILPQSAVQLCRIVDDDGKEAIGPHNLGLRWFRLTVDGFRCRGQFRYALGRPAEWQGSSNGTSPLDNQSNRGPGWSFSSAMKPSTDTEPYMTTLPWMDRKTNRSAPAASAAAIQVVKGDLGDPAPLRAAVEGSTASSR